MMHGHGLRWLQGVEAAQFMACTASASACPQEAAPHAVGAPQSAVKSCRPAACQQGT